jgi:hypothetical protein
VIGPKAKAQKLPKQNRKKFRQPVIINSPSNGATLSPIPILSDDNLIKYDLEI